MNKPTKIDRPLLADVAVAEGERLANDPNIVCVGIGLKLVRGRATPQAALQYHVLAKLAGNEEIRQAGSAPLPTEVHGYATDVIQWSLDRANACPPDHKPTGDRGGLKLDPLLGGTSTTVLGNFDSFPTGYGTLGGICFDAANGKAMALSNAHVYGNDLGNDVIQPWLPLSNYLKASLDYLFCGGPLSHLFFWTAPSPLTDILTGAAAAAWAAAICSDAEDPTRWGQRTSTVPPASAHTDREHIHVATEVPNLPFPGRHWQTKANWDYTRQTTAGQTNAVIDAPRENEHVLIGKRVFTDHDLYHAADRVRICAQLWTRAEVQPVEQFVVAHSFPLADPSRIVRRVLVPSDACAKFDQGLDHLREPHCLHGWTPQVDGLAEMAFPIVEAPFVLFSEAGATVLRSATAADNPSGVAALRLPADVPVNIACSPSTHVEVDVYTNNKKIRVTAYSANGAKIDQAESTDQKGVVQKLLLTGPEIVRLVVEGGGGEGYLVGLCVDKRIIDIGRWKGRSTYYTGTFDLGLNEHPGKWAVVVVAQTMDNTPTGGDPVQAARRLSGIVDTANAVETGECACTVLFDSMFDVG
jgi:hypothetical protein